MRKNQSMNLLIDNININFSKNMYLEKIIEDGFLFLDDCILLKKFSENVPHNLDIAASNFFDKVEFEWFYNSIQIYDHCKEFYLENSIYFLKNCLNIINIINNNIKLTAVCSINFNENISVKAGFYRNRPNEKSWLDDNIDLYEEAVIEFNSEELDLLPI